MCKRLSYLLSITLLMGLLTPGAGSADLVGWWKFDGDGLDASGNGLNGTLSGDAHYVAGYSGQALALDGDGDYFTVDGYKGLMSTSAVTVTAWVNTTETGDLGDIAYWGRNSGGRRVDFRVNAGRLRVEHGGGNLQGDTSLNDGEWHHVAVTIGAGVTISYPDVKLYLDGRDDSRDTTDTDPPFRLADHADNVDLTFGYRVPNGDRYCNGMLDDIRIYDRELSVAEIRDLVDLGYLASPHSPIPADGGKIEDTWGTLEWAVGPLATSRDFYFSTNFDDVNDRTEEAFFGNIKADNQAVGFAGFPAPDGLAPGTTYYWRVDEMNDAHPDSPWQGEVWSFWIPHLAAYDPVPADGNPVEQVDADLSWSPGLNTIMNAVYFGTDREQVANGAGAPPALSTTYDPGPLENATTYYWRVDTFNGAEWLTGPVWTFSTRPDIAVSDDPDLAAWWKFDEGAGITALDWSGRENHVTLLGSDWATGVFGNAGLRIGGHGAIQNLSYEASDLTAVTVCAWVRTTNGATQYIVSFDRDNYYRLEINGSGGGTGQIGWDVMTNSGQVDYGSVTRVDDGRWHHVTGVFDRGRLTIFIDGMAEPSEVGGATFGSGSTRFGFIGANSEATDFDGTRGSGSPVDGEVDDIRIYHRALTQQEILLVMLRGDPLLAWSPSPANGSLTGINRASTLNWSAGDGASQHDVYFGTDRDAVVGADAADLTGLYKGRQNRTSYTPEGVTMSSGPFYWRIDEVTSDGAIAKGGVWSFSVADYALIEDFESYNDIPDAEPGSNLVYVAWKDGFDNPNTNGSTMGYITAESMETNSVHGGRQSVAFQYNNSTAGLSEVVRTFASAQDWTANDVITLSLWFAGAGTNVPGQLYVKVNGVRKNYDGDASNLALAGWQPWNIDLASIATNLSAVASLAVGIQGSGATGTLLLDDIRLYAQPRELITPVQPDRAGLVLYYAFEGNANDSVRANHGTAFGNPIYAAGRQGQAMNLDGIDDYVAIDNFSYTSGGHPEVSVCAWIRTSLEDNQIIVSFDRSDYWRLQINGEGGGPGQVGWEVATDTGIVDYGGSARVDDGHWHHIAGVFDNGILTVYLDGNPQTPASGGPTFGTGTPRFGYVGLGSESSTFNADPRTPADFFNGSVDEVRIYNRSLTQGEIGGLAGRIDPFDKPF